MCLPQDAPHFKVCDEQETICQQTQQALIYLPEPELRGLVGETESIKTDGLQEVEQLRQMLQKEKTLSGEAASKSKTRIKALEHHLLDKERVAVETLADARKFKETHPEK